MLGKIEKEIESRHLGIGKRHVLNIQLQSVSSKHLSTSYHSFALSSSIVSVSKSVQEAITRCPCMYVVKYLPDGKINKLKATLVAKG